VVEDFDLHPYWIWVVVMRRSFCRRSGVEVRTKAFKTVSRPHYRSARRNSDNAWLRTGGFRGITCSRCWCSRLDCNKGDECSRTRALYQLSLAGEDTGDSFCMTTAVSRIFPVNWQKVTLPPSSASCPGASTRVRRSEARPARAAQRAGHRARQMNGAF
jgi:hypothetical protein